LTRAHTEESQAESIPPTALVAFRIAQDERLRWEKHFGLGRGDRLQLGFLQRHQGGATRGMIGPDPAGIPGEKREGFTHGAREHTKSRN